jgi:hypothetical protein
MWLAALALVAGSQAQPMAIALDATTVYWATIDGTIHRAPRTGGDDEILATGQGQVDDLAVDATSVYFTARQGVYSVPLKGGAVVTLTTDQVDARGVALDGPYLYFADYGDDGSGRWDGPGGDEEIAGAIRRVPRAGGKVETLISGPHPDALAADHGDVFFLCEDSDDVQTVRAGGHAAVSLTTLSDTPLFLAVSGGQVYVATISGEIDRVPRAGGAPMALATTGVQPGGFAVDTTRAWVTAWAGGNPGAGKVVAVLLTGGATSVIAAHLDAPSVIATDGKGLFVGTVGVGERSEPGAIWSGAPPSPP